MKTRFLLSLAAVALLLPAAALAQRAPIAAMVTDVGGAVKFSAAKVPLASSIATELPDGARIEVAAGGRVVLLMLGTGEELTLTGPAAAEVKTNGVVSTPPDRLARKASLVGKVRLKSDGLAQAAVTLRSSKPPESVTLLGLADTVTLESRPIFRWAPVQGVTLYRFELQDEGGKVLHEARVEGTELRLLEGVSLAEGRSYTWEVSARLANGMRYANFGDFKLAPAVLKAEAERLRPPPGASVSDRAAYAAWLASQDLRDDARRIWAQLAAERPDSENLKALAAP